MDLGKIPAMFVLSYMMEVFHKNVSAISRIREFEADKAAAEIESPKFLITALLKLTMYGGNWNDLQRQVIARMTKGSVTRNLSRLLACSVRYDVAEEKLPEVVGMVLEQSVSHPTDSHPTTSERMANLEVSSTQIDMEHLILTSDQNSDLIEDREAIEEQLTLLQQRYFLALGVSVPEEETNLGTFHTAFCAHMVLADGVVDRNEILEAEAIAASIMDDFDQIGFREYCNYADSLPEMEVLLEAFSDTDDEVKKLVLDSMTKIAAADGDVSSEETDLLERVRLSFKV